MTQKKIKITELFRYSSLPTWGGPRIPPPIVIRSIKGTNGLIVETEGKIIEEFSGSIDKVNLQKEKFLKDRCLIFD